MYVKNMRMSEIRKLKELPLEDGVLNTEALLLLLRKRCFSDHVERVFKYLDAQEDIEIMAKKHFVVVCLNKMERYRELEELIIPDSVVFVDGDLVGFAMPIIPNHKNLGVLVHDDSVLLREKIPYLKQLGDLIDKVQRIDGEKYRFQFGDLNEYNFIIDQNDSLKAIDLDSAYLGVGEPLDMAYYLLKNPYILLFPEKYKTSTNQVIIPTDDTDLYCYNMILLNVLAKENISKHDVDIYYHYIDYIRSFDLPDELLESFYNIYLPKHNLNPKEYLKEIDPSLEKKLEFKSFQKKYYK